MANSAPRPRPITEDEALSIFEMIFDSTPGTRDSFYDAETWMRALDAARAL